MKQLDLNNPDSINRPDSTLAFISPIAERKYYMQHEEAKLCPSSTYTKGASLIGIVQGNNTIDLLNTPIKINDAFNEKAKQHGDP
jgi:hypothetical protein